MEYELCSGEGGDHVRRIDRLAIDNVPNGGNRAHRTLLTSGKTLVADISQWRRHVK
ncbi:hypothetical protein [Micromonospora coerulea]|uniref:hypothetical protein n=1 Tax=Micromonospora coerulea TaxID=47856 RepID=UPI0019057342|nr:hypothetical protein [Micromonospora veneta]